MASLEADEDGPAADDDTEGDKELAPSAEEAEFAGLPSRGCCCVGICSSWVPPGEMETIDQKPSPDTSSFHT